MTNKTEKAYVLKEDCGLKVRNTRWFILTVVGLLGVVLTIVLYSVNQAQAANKAYNEVFRQVAEIRLESESTKSKINEYNERIKFSNLSLSEKMDDMKKQIKEQREEQKTMLEKILQLQIAMAQKSK